MRGQVRRGGASVTSLCRTVAYRRAEAPALGRAPPDLQPRSCRIAAETRRAIRRTSASGSWVDLSELAFPQPGGDSRDTSREAVAVGVERKAEELRGLLLGRRGRNVGVPEGAVELGVPRIGGQGFDGGVEWGP